MILYYCVMKQKMFNQNIVLWCKYLRCKNQQEKEQSIFRTIINKAYGIKTFGLIEVRLEKTLKLYLQWLDFFIQTSSQYSLTSCFPPLNISWIFSRILSLSKYRVLCLAPIVRGWVEWVVISQYFLSLKMFFYLFYNKYQICNHE